MNTQMKFSREFSAILKLKYYIVGDTTRNLMYVLLAIYYQNTKSCRKYFFKKRFIENRRLNPANLLMRNEETSENCLNL